jgi:glutaredoxin|tara:strand:- start:164 stop:412 length:249 start_codon:yes stop_codon:yes gene_type:complete
MFKIFTKDNCSWCTKAKEILKENNIKYKEHNIDEDYTSKMVLKALRLKTVPQIWNDDLHLGGYRQLESWIGENYDSNYIDEN